eukprot:13690630-Heterocapsa_arctica.AAC.1
MRDTGLPGEGPRVLPISIPSSGRLSLRTSVGSSAMSIDYRFFAVSRTTPPHRRGRRRSSRFARRRLRHLGK